MTPDSRDNWVLSRERFEDNLPIRAKFENSSGRCVNSLQRTSRIFVPGLQNLMLAFGINKSKRTSLRADLTAWQMKR